MLLALDVGGSQTRYTVNSGDIKEFDTDFSTIPNDTPVIKEKAHPKEELTIQRNNEKPIRLLKGEAINAYVSSVKTLIPQEFKARTDGTYYNVIYTIAKTCLEDDIGEGEIYIGQCLPPVELYGGYADEYKNRLAGKYKIEFPHLSRSLQFDIKEKNIMLTPEGICCRKSITDEEVKTLQFPTLVIDIGYRSTDIALLIKGSHLKVQHVHFLMVVVILKRL